MPAPCTHDWNLPPNSACPSCLWSQALSGTPKKRLEIVARAVEIAIKAATDNRQERERLRILAKREGNWHVIRLARMMNQDKKGKVNA